MNLAKQWIALAIASAMTCACSDTSTSTSVCGFQRPYVELTIDLPVAQVREYSEAIQDLDIVRGGRQDVNADMLRPPEFTPPVIRITLPPGTDRDVVRVGVKRVAKDFGGEGIIKGMSFVLGDGES